MNFQYYIHYIAIVEEGSLTSASHKLRVAQPALSNQVKALEEAYGARLFYRGSGGRKLELTDAGRILYEKSKLMAEAESAARKEIENCFGSTSSSLRLGIAESLGNRYLIRALDAFAEKFPETEILLHESKEDDLMKMLQRGLVEGVFLRSEEQKFEGFDTIFSQRDYRVASYRQNAFFVGNDSAGVSITELAKFPLCVTEEHLSMLRAAFRKYNTPFTPKFIGTNTTACLHWARAGKGVALIPRLSLPMLDFFDLQHKNIAGEELAVASLTFVTQKTQFRSRVINSFLESYRNLNDDKVIHYRSDATRAKESE